MLKLAGSTFHSTFVDAAACTTVAQLDTHTSYDLDEL